MVRNLGEAHESLLAHVMPGVFHNFYCRFCDES